MFSGRDNGVLKSKTLNLVQNKRVNSRAQSLNLSFGALVLPDVNF